MYVLLVQAALICATQDTDATPVDLGFEPGPEVLEHVLSPRRLPEALVVQAMGRISSGGIPPLLKFIKHDDPVVRAHAAIGLGRGAANGADAVEALVATTEDDDGVVRLAAISALGGLEAANENVVRCLIELLQDDSPEIRAAAASSLGWIGPPAKIAAPKLKRLLTDDDRLVRLEARFSLQRFSGRMEEAVNRLAEILKDADSKVQCMAATALGRIGPAAKPVVPDLIELAKSSDSKEVCSAAITALGGIGPDAKAAVPVLLEILGRRKRTKIKTVRLFKESVETYERIIDPISADIIETLGRIGPSAGLAAPKLKELAATAALGVARFGTPPDMVTGWHNEIVCGVHDLGLILPALEAISPGETISKLIRAIDGKEGFLEGRRRGPFSPDLASPLIQCTKDSHPRVREMAARFMERHVPKEGGVPSLIELLKDPDTEVRRVAVRILGRPASSLGKPSIRRTSADFPGNVVVPAFLPLLEDDDLEVRSTAVASLGQYPEQSESSIPALLPLLNDKDSTIRRRAVSSVAALDSTGDIVAAFLLPMLEDSDISIRRSVLGSMFFYPCPLHSEQVVPAVKRLLKDEDLSIRRDAALVMRKIGPEARSAVPELIDMLDTPEQVCIQACAALGAIGADAKPAVPHLIKLLDKHQDDGSIVFSWVAKALREIGPAASDAIPLLTELSEHPNARIRRYAAPALKGIVGSESQSESQSESPDDSPE